ncbi:MAG TPA: hypothetical protein VFW02_01755 [Candidatus Limnocylindrales bacterium]|nr:hypothetical protein [Candidatus Limnocylindrales bacterium]
MPEFTVKEVRLPELHLPEIKRDEIVRSLSGVRLPEVDLAKARNASIKLPAVSVSSADVGRLVAAAAAIARIVRPTPSRTSWLAGALDRRSRSPLARIVQPRRRRSRWPFAVGGILIIGLGTWAVLRRPAVRERLNALARDARGRFDELRSTRRNTAMEVHEPVALATTAMDASETGVPATATDDAGSASAELEHPGEPGAIVADAAATPALEESGTPS